MHIPISEQTEHNVMYCFLHQEFCLSSWPLFGFLIQGDSLTRGPKVLSMYTVEQRGFLVLKYWQTGSFKACQTAFRTEFGERRAPSKCCIQKLVKKLETGGKPI